MSRILRKELGFYVPSYFYLKINEYFDEQSFADIMLSSVYFHEFIHYLQDISTTYGMMSLRSNISCIQSDVYTAQRSKLIIRLPITKKVGNASQNEDLTSTLIGDERGPDNPIITKIDRGCFVNSDYQSIRLEVSGVYYIFGVIAIHETMAYLAEQVLFKSYVQSPDLPYMAGLYVAKFIYPTFCKDIRNVVALCDASLMCCNPPEVFYESLKQMKEQNFLPRSYLDVYEYIGNLIKYPNFYTHYELYNYNAELALESLRAYLGQDATFNKEYEFVKDSIQKIKDIRRAKPFFILEMLDKQFSLDNYISLISLIKMPITYNCYDEGFVDYRYPETCAIDFGVFRSMFEVSLFFYHSVPDNSIPVQYECGLMNYCKSSPLKQSIDGRCYKAPWERSQDKELCPFAKIWHRWGLTDKKLEYY